ncbi:MAG: polysaccharide deacetylase family protein [Christiangramia sp.]|nr:polysaccharide deacetylase family protein [Christiangramia sp.]
MNGALIISLDFELLWGVFDTIDYINKKSYFQNTRAVIPAILKEFQDNNIHATWATVGMLFNKDWKEWEDNVPRVLPEYKNRKLSAYDFGRKNKGVHTEDLCFAPDLIDQILNTSGQEIGTHTYSHYYCLEPDQTAEAFKQDLKQSIHLAEKVGVELKSLVFPRNQINEDYLNICADLGIINVRSNPQSWYWNNSRSEALVTKLARTGDAYLPLGKKSYSRAELQDSTGFPLTQRASRFLRPIEENRHLRKFKLKRILQEMESAAQNGEIYHLWWHPHNFGDNPAESINDLRILIEEYSDLNRKYDFRSLNMMELGESFS